MPHDVMDCATLQLVASLPYIPIPQTSRTYPTTSKTSPIPQFSIHTLTHTQNLLLSFLKKIYLIPCPSKLPLDTQASLHYPRPSYSLTFESHPNTLSLFNNKSVSNFPKTHKNLQQLCQYFNSTEEQLRKNRPNNYLFIPKQYIPEATSDQWGRQEH